MLSVALEAGYSSHEAFTRAFARAYGRSPSQWRRRPTRFQLEAPSEVHFNPPGGLRVPAHGKVTPMELLTRMVEHHVWLVGEMLTRAERLLDEVLDAPVEISVEGLDDEPTLRSLLSRLVGQLAMWDAAIHDRPYDFGVEKGESVASMRARLAESGPAFLTQARDRRRGPSRRDLRRRDLRPARGVHLRRDDRPRAHVRSPPPDTRLRGAHRRRRHRPRGRRPDALGSRARVILSVLEPLVLDEDCDRLALLMDERCHLIARFELPDDALPGGTTRLSSTVKAPGLPMASRTRAPSKSLASDRKIRT